MLKFSIPVVSTVVPKDVRRFYDRIKESFQRIEAYHASSEVTESAASGISARITSAYTLLPGDTVVFCNTDAGAYTVTIPFVVQGKSYRIVNTGSSGNNLTLSPSGTVHLLGANSSFILGDAEALDITYDEVDGWY